MIFSKRLGSSQNTRLKCMAIQNGGLLQSQPHSRMSHKPIEFKIYYIDLIASWIIPLKTLQFVFCQVRYVDDVLRADDDSAYLAFIVDRLGSQQFCSDMLWCYWDVALESILCSETTCLCEPGALFKLTKPKHCKSSFHWTYMGMQS